MEKTLASGKTKAIGLSNFSRKEIERLLRETEVVPAVHQIELHPWLQQRDLDEFHKSKGIHISHYSPLASSILKYVPFCPSNSECSFGNSNEIYDKGKNIGKLIDDPTLIEIGKKYGKSGAQTALGNISTSPFRRLKNSLLKQQQEVSTDVDNLIQHGALIAVTQFYPKAKPQLVSGTTSRQISN